MSKKILIFILIILILLSGVGIYLYMENSKEDSTIWVVPNLLEPYIRIQKNTELSSTELTLNGNNKEMYYYFDIFNYDDSINEYSQLDILPYVKLDIQNENNIQNLVNINLYYIKDISLGFIPENLEEITLKGEVGSNFENYFECKKLEEYDEKNSSQNVAHYVAKITLNTENQEYMDLTQNIAQKLEVVLGYKQYTR